MDEGGVDGLLQRGQALLEQGDPRAAVEVLEEAVAVEPGRASLYEPLARALFATAQIGRARAAFEHMLELDPTDHYAHFGVGRCWERQGDLEQARTHFRLASALADRADYATALGRVEERLRRRR